MKGDHSVSTPAPGAEPGLARWIALFGLPTLAFKYFYLTELYGTSGGSLRLGLFTILDASGEGGGWAARALRLADLLCVDVLEVTVFCAVLYWTLSLVAPRIRQAAMAATLGFALFLTLLNAISVRQLGTLLTGQTLAIAYDWSRQHPSILGHFVSLPKLVVVLLSVLWSASPLIVDRIGLVPPRWDGVRRRLAALVLGGAVVGSLFGLSAWLRMTPNAPRAFAGYWSSAVLSLGGRADPGPCAGGEAAPDDVLARYRRLVYPEGTGPAPVPLAANPIENPRPRHVIIVALETAPRKFYPITDDPTLPTFYRMSKTALVSDRHYTPVPTTKAALFSLMSGTYPRPGRGLQGFGDFESDSMATVLAKNGYETSFIDSYKIDWMPGLDDRRMWRDLGFQHLIDEESDTPMHEFASYESLAENERHAFAKILDAVAGADARGRKALVLAATAIGHYEWKARGGDEALPAAAKVHRLAEFLDDRFAELLQGLAERGLENECLILVTGDHGLRYGAEFASLGEPPGHGDAEFNVPFLLYAPGVISRTVEVPYLTSHVDVAPTVLALLGLSDRSRIFHGSSMLDGRIADRTTFMLDTNLAPVSGFYRRGIHYIVNHLTGAVSSRPDAREPGRPAERLSDEAVKATLAEADRVFDATDCVFLGRAAAR